MRAVLFGSWGVARKVGRLPKFNELDIVDLPYDFFEVISYRFYLESINESISCYDNLERPPRYIIHTPALYEAWVEWADKESLGSDKDGQGRPLIKRLGELGNHPDWVKYEFQGLEDFYQYFNYITKEI